MKTLLPSLVILCVSHLFIARGSAQPAMVQAPPRTHTEQADALAVGVTKAEKLNWMRNTIRQGPSGQKGLEHIFKNFEGPHYIDPRIPGVAQSIRTAASYHLSHRIGAERTLLYAIPVYNDPRFELVRLNEPVYRADGKMDTDKDLVIRDRENGNRIRIESKGGKTTSQASDAKHIQGQIVKMAKQFKTTGELQVFVSRNRTPPNIQDFAHQHGVAVYDVTRQKDFRVKVLNEIKIASNLKTKASLTGGASGLGFAIWMLAKSGPEAWTDLQDVMASEGRNTAALLRLGEHGAMSLAGAAGITAGTARIIAHSKLLSNVKTLNKVSKVSRLAGRAGLVAFIVAEGFVIAQWRTGNLSDRQFYTVQAGLVGGAVGSFAGAGLGFLIGGPLGAIIGGIDGGILGGELGERIASNFYARLDEGQRQQVEISIYQHYGVSR